MGYDLHVYDDINNQTNLKEVFREIRRDIDRADTRPGLTELYRRADDLIALTCAPDGEEKFGQEAPKIRAVALEQFRTTARKINRRAKQLGVEPDYDEKWRRKPMSQLMPSVQ